MDLTPLDDEEPSFRLCPRCKQRRHWGQFPVAVDGVAPYDGACEHCVAADLDYQAEVRRLAAEAASRL